MNGWDLGGRPDLLQENEDDEQDREPDKVLDARKTKTLRYLLGAGCKLGRSSPSTFPSHQRKRRRENIWLLKKGMAHQSSSG